MWCFCGAYALLALGLGALRDDVAVVVVAGGGYYCYRDDAGCVVRSRRVVSVHSLNWIRLSRPMPEWQRVKIRQSLLLYIPPSIYKSIGQNIYMYFIRYLKSVGFHQRVDIHHGRV